MKQIAITLLLAAGLSARLAAQTEDLPFVIGEVFDDHKRDVVRAGQKTAAESVSNAAFATSQGLKTAEGIHFIAASQIELGNRFALAMIKLCKQNATSKE